MAVERASTLGKRITREDEMAIVEPKANLARTVFQEPSASCVISLCRDTKQKQANNAFQPIRHRSCPTAA
jgi:hypothetical protein